MAPATSTNLEASDRSSWLPFWVHRRLPLHVCISLAYHFSRLISDLFLVAQLPMDGNNVAYLPFSASVMGPKGDDLMLVQMMKHTFDVVDWRIRVDTGDMTYPLGTNSRNVDDNKQDPVPDPGPGAFAAASADDDSEL